MVLKVSLNTGINRIRLEFKADPYDTVNKPFVVLIESDWNLKSGRSSGEYRPEYRINRIRLEFKGV